jgi:hypothetical protein
MPDHHISYVESDVPAEQTLAEWRRSRTLPVARRRRLRLRTFIPARRPAFAAV